MKVFYELTTKKSFSEYDLNDEVMISVRYRYSGKRLNTSTGVSVKIKDWDGKWRSKRKNEPIKPCSSANNVNIKSVCFSGKNSK